MVNKRFNVGLREFALRGIAMNGTELDLISGWANFDDLFDTRHSCLRMLVLGTK